MCDLARLNGSSAEVALAWYTKAAALGSADALFALAQHRLTSDPLRAASELADAAARGHVGAMSLLRVRDVGRDPIEMASAAAAHRRPLLLLYVELCDGESGEHGSGVVRADDGAAWRFARADEPLVLSNAPPPPDEADGCADGDWRTAFRRAACAHAGHGMEPSMERARQWCAADAPPNPQRCAQPPRRRCSLAFMRVRRRIAAAWGCARAHAPARSTRMRARSTQALETRTRTGTRRRPSSAARRR